MKKIMFFFIIFIVNTVYSQNNNIKIEYIFIKKNSKKDSSLVSKKYDLIISENQSTYLTEDKVIENPKLNKNVNFDKPLQSKSIFVPDEIIVFNKKNNELTTYKELMESPIGYSEMAPTSWNLLNKTKMVNDSIQLHLAEINFGGRKWFAWYSNNYSLSDGPYKFKNLPGLIFEVYDDEKIFNFQLIKISKVNESFNFDKNKYYITTKKKYIEVQRSYVYNPSPKLMSIFTKDSQVNFRKSSIEKHKNRYYLEKDLE